jgi:hypothetical protein
LHSPPNRAKWIAVTAGLLPINFEAAASRLGRDLIGLYPFYKILTFTFKDLHNCAPKVCEKYESYLKEEFPGFGHYCWKSEIVNRTLNGEFGECDGVVWVDGGCEIFNSPWTRHTFRKQIIEAEKLGYSVYQLETPEYQYPLDLTGQVQANYFFLAGELGRKISNSWAECTLRDIRLLDDSPSAGGEAKDFVAHKADQSILSLVVKSLGATERMRVPPAGNRGIFSQLKAMKAPVWIARNREGKTIKTPLVRIVEFISKRTFRSRMYTNSKGVRG